MTTQPLTLIEQTSREKDHPPIPCYPGPVLPDSLTELVAVAQNPCPEQSRRISANILQIPEDTPVTLELAGPATIILACPVEFDRETTDHLPRKEQQP